MSKFEVISPIDGSLYTERALADEKTINTSIELAKKAQKHWNLTSLSRKKEIINKFTELLQANREKLATEITWQIGRPITQTPSEIDGAVFRAKHLISIADEALNEMLLPNHEQHDSDNLTKKIKLCPLGLVFIIAPWNYPYLTTINTLIPALLSGNSVLIKHSSQTPTVAENIVQLLLEAGLPENVCQYLHISHKNTTDIIAGNNVDYVAFTGSNPGGREIIKALGNCMHHASLELGGKDAAYVKQDADLDYTVAQLVDGSFYNTGQSCCAVERIYVDQRIYAKFVESFVALTNKLILDNPLEQQTTLGPMVKKSAADNVRKQVDDAVRLGARKLIDKKIFRKDTANSAYLSPQVLIDVNHDMSFMRDETFGPAVGIMPVHSDTEAIALINDSNYGLTCSVWTKDSEYAETIFNNIDVGTCLLNKCDYLDPALAWTGVKDTGYGCSLSKLGFLQVTRPKSYYLLKK